MTDALYFPPADHVSQWFGSGNATVAPIKVLWHSTETAGGWPGYNGGASAPNLTYEPWQHRWRQHFPLNGTARALRNGTGYQTNRQGVCQVEVSCYCDPARFDTGKGINRLDAQAYDDMGAFAAFMHTEWGVPLFTGVAFLPYPQSYGNNGVRLSRAQFTAYYGHLDHMHAPDNQHGDAGTMDVPRLLAAAQGDNMTSEEHEWLRRTHEILTAGPSGDRFVEPYNLAVETKTAVTAANLALHGGHGTLPVGETNFDWLRDQTAELIAAIPPVDVVALAAVLAPLLADQNVTVNLDDDQLAAIAVAVADEQARRLIA